MSATRARGRGIVMMLVLILVALLLIVALAVIAGSNTATLSASAVSIKYRVLNTAEGAANQALDGLVRNPGAPNGTHLRGRLNNVPWDAYIGWNNLGKPGGQSFTDPVTGQTVTMPTNSAYIYGSATDDGGRKTTIEAIVEPTLPLQMPKGALNAGGDIHDLGAMAINADTGDTTPNDANVSALGSIFTDQAPPPTVQGDTAAGGNTNQLPGADGNAPTNVRDAVTLPTPTQIAQATRTAALISQAGLVLTPDQLQQSAAGGHAFSGNVYVTGDVTIGSTPITFNQGTYVYINGNLCIASGGSLSDLNSGQNEIVVAGDVFVQNGGTYQIAPGNNTLMIVLGSDGASTPCNNTHAVDIVLTNDAMPPFGTIFAANGSIDLSGGGSVIGAFDASRDLILEGSNAKVGMQYDAQQAATSLYTGTLGFQSYIEY